MKITSRIKLALPSFLMGAFVALGAMAYASEPAHVIPTSKAGIHCEAYTKAGETFDCRKIDAEGSVTEVTTFLVSADSNGSLVYAELVPTDSVVQSEGHGDSSDSADSDGASGGTAIVDTDDSDGGSVDNTVGGSVPATEEVLVEVAEGVNDDGFWKSFTTKAVLLYGTTSTSLHDKYLEMFPAEQPTDVEASADEPQPEADSEVPTVEKPEATAPPVDHPLVEEEVMVVVSNSQAYAHNLYSMKDSHLVYESEVNWLAMNMMFEARNQGSIGTAAVADVTIKRLDIHMRGDKTVYDIVTDPAEFTWVGDAVPDVLMSDELEQYSQAVTAARELLIDYMNGDWVPWTCNGQGATHYHKTDIVPDWQATMDVDCGIIGDHHFWIGK